MYTLEDLRVAFESGRGHELNHPLQDPSVTFFDFIQTLQPQAEPAPVEKIKDEPDVETAQIV